MSAVCGRCGDCCRATWLRHDRATLAAQLPRREALAADETLDPEVRAVEAENAETSRFVLAHWREITEGEAQRRLPGFLAGGEGGAFYACDRFDEATNRCTAHDDRPPICRDYPWYRKGPSERNLHRCLTHCTYWADLPEESRPPGWSPVAQPPIQITRKGAA